MIMNVDTVRGIIMEMNNLNFDEVESVCDQKWVRLKMTYSDNFYPFFTKWVKRMDLQKVLREFADKIRNEDDGIYVTVQAMNVKVVKGVQYGFVQEEK